MYCSSHTTLQVSSCFIRVFHFLLVLDKLLIVWGPTNDKILGKISTGHSFSIHCNTLSIPSDDESRNVLPFLLLSLSSDNTVFTEFVRRLELNNTLKLLLKELLSLISGGETISSLDNVRASDMIFAFLSSCVMRKDLTGCIRCKKLGDDGMELPTDVIRGFMDLPRDLGWLDMILSKSGTTEKSQLKLSINVNADQDRSLCIH